MKLPLDETYSALSLTVNEGQFYLKFASLQLLYTQDVAIPTIIELKLAAWE